MVDTEQSKAMIAKPSYELDPNFITATVEVSPTNGEPAKIEVRSAKKISNSAVCVLHVEIDGQRATFDANLVSQAIAAAQWIEPG
ncbi:hypothetical protein [Ruegeria sp. ANG-R]|uniref:hypothetical protein n=1 Tax=Ruegeria sp. ANG-R TaxID=1577903 RepID=UPI000B119042|nr:hypothetical protein [Ruegeria sp. ANG-R]